MAIVTDIRKSVTESTPVLAVVGLTDAAVKQVREVAANASTFQAEVESRVSKAQAEFESRVSKAQAEFESRVSKAQADFTKTFSSIDAEQVQTAVTKALDPKSLQATAQQVPALAVSRVLELAGRAETVYEGLAARGKKLVDAIEAQKPTQDLIAQGKSTLSRTKAAVTTARKAIDDTATATLNLVGVGRSSSEEALAEVEASVEAAAEKTAAAAKKTTATARKRVATTRSAAKGAGTSARKTAAKAVDAAQAAADKVGE